MSKIIEVFRFMSREEKMALEEGKTLTNGIDYSLYRRGVSTAKGFTFGIGDKDAAVFCSRKLKGVVTMQWLLCAIASDEIFKDCIGRYPEYYDKNGNGIGERYDDEKCIEKYSLADLMAPKFYICNGIGSYSRMVILGNRACTRKEINTLAFANRMAKYNYNRIVGCISFADLI